MCWNCAYINTRKLCCTVVLTGNETNDSQVPLHITFSCRYETITDTWEEFPPPIFPQSQSWSAAKHSTSSSHLTSYIKHTSHCQGEPGQSVLITLLYLLDIYWTCLPVIFLFATYIPASCFCSTAANVFSSHCQKTCFNLYCKCLYQSWCWTVSKPPQCFFCKQKKPNN